MAGNATMIIWSWPIIGAKDIGDEEGWRTAGRRFRPPLFVLFAATARFCTPSRTLVHVRVTGLI